MFKRIIDNIKNKKPLIHCITNYVTVNDCANILLACGASPVMADDLKEVEDITSISSGLCINIGTLNERTVESMIKAGRKANSLGIPVLLDPVGAGASGFRTEVSNRLLKEINFTVIRGNISEIKALSVGGSNTKGVDADLKDKIHGEDKEKLEFIKDFSRKTNSIIVVTGEVDIIAEKDKISLVRNGSPKMSDVTGTGCQLSCIITAYISANKDDIFKAVISAVAGYGYCGEQAEKRLSNLDGNSTYRNYIIDAVYNMLAESLEKGAKYEIL